jgi:cell division protein FtsI (penicillin-binding protein 3)
MLIGYSSAGKTGTAQKVDPATHAYSHTKYVASFGGFAPVNDPAITVAVVLDSAVGLHQGGQVSAPVFTRIVQQVLGYLNTPHDLELPAGRQVLLARTKTNDKDLEEGSPDHPGEAIDIADAASSDTIPPLSAGAQAGAQMDSATAEGKDRRPSEGNLVVSAAMRVRTPLRDQKPPVAIAASAEPTAANIMPATATVVLDVEQGGIVVPSFVGRSVRSAIELAESSGLDLDVSGSGLGQEQNPPAGARVPSGARIRVRFGR